MNTTNGMTLFDQVHEKPVRVRTLTEQQKKDQVMDTFEHKRKEWLTIIRLAMRKTWIERRDKYGPDAYVTADDAREFFEAIPDVPGPKRLSRIFLGAVFMPKCWKWTGNWHKSETEGSHGNPLKCWRYIGS